MAYFSENVGQIYFFMVSFTGQFVGYFSASSNISEDKKVLFYDVELKTIPKIKYNCTVIAPKYRATVAKNPDLFELCYIESGECVCQSGRDAVICEAGHLYPLFFPERSELYTECDVPVRMITVGVEAQMEISVVNSEKLSEDETRALMKNMLSGNRFLLPCEGMSSLAYDWLLPYIKKIVSCSIGERIGEETRAMSLILEFLSRITKSSMDTVAFDARAFSTSAIAYSEMVVSYIVKNYRRRISVSDIAEAFDLTPNYLHTIFKQVKGTTIVDYLTSYRMSIAKTYIERFGLRAYEAAELVGIDDPAYFSRLFKKLYGVSVNDFKKGENS